MTAASDSDDVLLNDPGADLQGRSTTELNAIRLLPGDNFLRQRDGFFSLLTTRQDAVQAATVTVAACGAQIGGGTGAVTIPARHEQTPGQRIQLLSPRIELLLQQVNGLPRNELRLYQYGGASADPL